MRIALLALSIRWIALRYFFRPVCFTREALSPGLIQSNRFPFPRSLYAGLPYHLATKKAARIEPSGLSITALAYLLNKRNA